MYVNTHSLTHTHTHTHAHTHARTHRDRERERESTRARAHTHTPHAQRERVGCLLVLLESERPGSNQPEINLRTIKLHLHSFE